MSVRHSGPRNKESPRARGRRRTATDGSALQEAAAVPNLPAPNRASERKKQKLMKPER